MGVIGGMWSVKMEFMELIGLMGQTTDHPLIRKHLMDAGITQPPSPPEGESAAYVQFPEQGYEMRFDRQPDGRNPVFLRSMTAFPKGDATHQPFLEKLPLDIKANELRDALIARLGAPLTQNKIFHSDLWKLGTLDVVVGYEKSDQKSIRLVQVNVPRK